VRGEQLSDSEAVDGIRAARGAPTRYRWSMATEKPTRNRHKTFALMWAVGAVALALASVVLFLGAFDLYTIVTASAAAFAAVVCFVRALSNLRQVQQ